MELKETLKKTLTEGCFLQTSGTTGEPKPIWQSVEKLQAANSVARECQLMDVNSRILTVCTLKHAGGLLAQTLPAYEIGAHIEVQPFNAFAWVRQIGDYTHSHLTPDMARAIMKTKSFERLNLDGITVMCGSDRVNTSIIQNFIDRGCTFIVNWGMTEIGPCAINKTFKPGMHINFSETVMGDTAWCETTIEEKQLWVKGDICVYDDWFATGDIVEQQNKMFYFLGRI